MINGEQHMLPLKNNKLTDEPSFPNFDLQNNDKWRTAYVTAKK